MGPKDFGARLCRIGPRRTEEMWCIFERELGPEAAESRPKDEEHHSTPVFWGVPALLDMQSSVRPRVPYDRYGQNHADHR